ncbi:MAG: hypothetical protein K2G47_06070 [Muribaculum sp.]|nr:hypothetical protein [Muribaculum sp.]
MMIPDGNSRLCTLPGGIAALNPRLCRDDALRATRRQHARSMSGSTIWGIAAVSNITPLDRSVLV